jgi:hypothetical protein
VGRAERPENVVRRHYTTSVRVAPLWIISAPHTAARQPPGGVTLTVTLVYRC